MKGFNRIFTKYFFILVFVTAVIGCGGGEKSSSESARLPEIHKVTALNSHYLEIEFVSPVANTEISTNAFEIESDEGKKVVVRNIIFSPDKISALLVVSGLNETAYTLRHASDTSAVSTFSGLDNVEPKLLSAKSLSSKEVLLEFDIPMNQVSVEGFQFYEIDDKDISISRITWQDARANEVILETTAQKNKEYILTFNNVQQSYANILHKYYIDPKNNKVSFKGILPTDSEAPVLVSVTAETGNTILLAFSEPLQPASVDLSKFYFSPVLEVKKAELVTHGTQVRLTTTAQASGERYSLTISPTVKDNSGNALALGSRVVEVNTAGNKDTEAPRIASVTSTANDKVLITFSEPVTNEADNSSYYEITRTSSCDGSEIKGSKLTVLNVSLSANMTSVMLTTARQRETTYHVLAANITDVSGNQLELPRLSYPFTPSFRGTPEGNQALDSDGDGLSDAEEQFGWAVKVTSADGTVACRDVSSDPTVADSDGDGRNDLAEQQAATDPHDNDTDNDGLTDEDELVQYGTNPNNVNTDGDAYGDYAEVFVHQTDPTVADTAVTNTSDKQAPVVSSVGAVSNNKVVISFSEAMGNSAENAENYQITRAPLCTGQGAAGVRLPIISASLNDDKTSVTLTTLSQTETAYSVTVNNIKDLAGNQVQNPEFLVNQNIISFAGVAPGGSKPDSDNDGLSDDEEVFGWMVMSVLVDGSVVCKDVSSDPHVADTDGDQIADAEEQTRGLNPRDTDTDNDSLGDYDEANVYWTNYLLQDTDGDLLLDGDEVNIFKTSAMLADTDGDSYRDDSEIFERSSHPLIADTPKAALELVGDAVIKLNVKYTDQTSFTTAVEKSFSDEHSFVTQTTETTVQKAAGAENISDPIGFWAGIKSLFTRSSIMDETFEETETSTTETTSDAYRNAYADYLSSSRNRTEEVSNGFVKMGLQVRNTGDIAFTLKNLSVTVLQRDPFTRRATRALATLKPAVPSVTLGPTGETGVLVVEETAAPATLIKDMLANPTGLMFEVATFDLEDADGRNFAFLSEVTHSRTALLTIDYGDGRIDRFRVATDVKRNLDGTTAGISLGEVMQDIVKLDYETKIDNVLNPSGGTAQEQTLIRIGNVATNLEQKKFWMMIGSREQHVTAGQNFDDVVLKSGDQVFLAFVTDADKDGLIARQEFLYGTKDTEPDTDGDGLTDFEEVKEGWIVTTDQARQVFSNPRSADADRDGYNDLEEKELFIAGLGTGPSDPNNFDTDGDSLCDGPGRLDNPPDPDSRYYICRLGAVQDNKPLEPALLTPPGILVAWPLPQTLNAKADTDILAQFDQKIATARGVYVYGAFSGVPLGTLSFALDPSGNPNSKVLEYDPIGDFLPGELVEVSLTREIKNIDDYSLTPFNYRFRTAVTNTGSKGNYFGSEIYETGGTYPGSVTHADFNGDGLADAAIYNMTSHNFAVLLNDGRGKYRAPAVYSLQNIENGNGTIVHGDFNNDDFDDIAIAYYVSDTKKGELAIFLNDGVGKFGVPFNKMPLESAVTGMEVGDFNNDGKLDLAVANDYLTIVLGLGGGLFNTPVNYSAEFTIPGGGTYPGRAGDLTIGDFDGDSDLDIAIAISSNVSVRPAKIYFNNGSGIFDQTTSYYHSQSNGASFSITLADIDGDDDLDVLLGGTSQGEAAMSYLVNNGSGVFQLSPLQFLTGNYPLDLEAADFNNDGYIDYYARVDSYSWRSSLKLFTNQGDGTFLETHDYGGLGFIDMDVVDLDNDGDLDLSVTNNISGPGLHFERFSSIHVFRNRANGEFVGPNAIDDIDTAISPFDGNPYVTSVDRPGIVTADFDGDRKLDVALVHQFSVATNPDKVAVYLNQGDFKFSQAVTYPIADGSTEIITADFDADGDMDLATADPNNHVISVLLNNGNGSFASSVQYLADNYLTSLTTGDLDGDGDLDIAVAGHSSNSTVAVLLNNGYGVFASSLKYPGLEMADGITSADLDGDGDLDLAVSSNRNHQVAIIKNNGDATFATPTIYDDTYFGKQVVAGDLDGDRDIDLVISGHHGEDQSNVDPLKNKLAVMLNDGNGTFSSVLPFPAGLWQKDLKLGDIDADNDLDIVVASQMSYAFTVLFNNGQASFADHKTYHVGDAESVTLGDMDGDGDLEIIGAGNYNSPYLWILENELSE